MVSGLKVGIIILAHPLSNFFKEAHALKEVLYRPELKKSLQKDPISREFISAIDSPHYPGDIINGQIL